MQSLLLILISCNECGKNLIAELMSAASPKMRILRICSVRTKFGKFINPQICLLLLLPDSFRGVEA